MKDHLVQPDVIVHLGAMKGNDTVTESGGSVKIGGLITLDALSRHPLIREKYAVLADAADFRGLILAFHRLKLALNMGSARRTARFPPEAERGG